MRIRKRADKIFLSLVIALVFFGTLIFVSAWFGLLAHGTANGDTQYTGVLFTHAVSVVLGFLIMVGASNVPFAFWKKYSLYIFIVSLILTAAVFIPVIGFEYNGAQRWLHIGPVSLQPSEFLKIGFILFFAAFLSSLKGRVNSFKEGLAPILGTLGIISALLIKQPDTGTLMVIIASAIGMFLAAGGYWRHLFIFMLTGFLGILFLAFTRPYVMERFTVFLDPSKDHLNSGWQITQSLIAVGSGGVTGRGFGQSIQKFNYLPEAINDAIFPVASEEFGFIGSTGIVILFLALAFRGFKIASRAPNQFSGLVVVGIVIMITAQAFINISAMLSLIPLTGVPLPFISHGGTALVLLMLAVGIVLNVSKQT